MDAELMFLCELKQNDFVAFIVYDLEANGLLRL